MTQKFSSHLLLAQAFWKNFLHPQDHVIDATCGNGHDTLFLTKLIPEGHLYAFDIQKKAIENTQKLLQEHHCNAKVSFFLSSHEHLDLALSPKIRLIVYNLGYLPGSDKTITTLLSSTQKSLTLALKIAEENKGAISLMCYPGHKEGQEEFLFLKEKLEALDKSLWQVSHHQWINRPLSPSLFWIEKK